MAQKYHVFLTIVLMFFAFGEGQPKRGGGNPLCVSNRPGRRVKHNTEVATCQFGVHLKDKIQLLEAITVHLEEKVHWLREDVNRLQGNDTRLYRLIAIVDNDRRQFCEIYNHAEAEEICKLAFEIENPNPHFVHIPCGKKGNECPDTFWRIKPGCFRPNAGPLALFDCFVDPVGETCTDVVFLGCEGYTENLAEGWEEINNNDVE